MEERDVRESHFSLLKKLVVQTEDKSPLMASARQIKKIIQKDLPAALEKEAPPNLPALCFDLQEVYEQFEDFLVFRDLIGKQVVALGGGFSSGKSSFLNGLLSEKAEKKQRLLPVDTQPSTAVPTYLISAEEEKITAVNMFDSRLEGLTVDDVHAIGHDFEEENEGISLGQLIQRMFIATPHQTYAHIAFLDTPGYSRPDTESYSVRTDEQIAREQLNHSHFILWFLNGTSLIPQSDIQFLKNLDPNIPKAIILNKADKVLVEGLETYREVIDSIKRDLKKNGIAVKGVWGYTNRPKRKRIPEDIAAVHQLLDALNQKKEESRFGHDFMQLFVECRKYYQKELAEDTARLKRVNSALVCSDKTEVKDNLQDSLMILQKRIKDLETCQKNLETQQARFFDLIRKVGAQAGILIPTPSEIQMAEENAADPGVILSQLMKERGLSADLILTEKLKSKLEQLWKEESALPGSAGYEKRLLHVLESNLDAK